MSDFLSDSLVFQTEVIFPLVTFPNESNVLSARYTIDIAPALAVELVDGRTTLRKS
jgi:hypothetical protein